MKESTNIQLGGRRCPENLGRMHLDVGSETGGLQCQQNLLCSENERPLLEDYETRLTDDDSYMALLLSFPGQA